MIVKLLELLEQWLTAQDLWGFVRVFENIEFRAFCAGFCAFLIVLATGPRTIAWLRRRKIGDAARFDVAALDEAMASKQNTPTMGGVLIAGAILLCTLIFGNLENRYVHLAIVVLVWHAAIGGVDDWLKLTAASRGEGSRQGLYAWEKLVFQLGVGLLVGYFAFGAGFVGAGEASPAYALNLPFQKTYVSGTDVLNPAVVVLPLAAYMVIMTLMMTGMSNAVNITDGMDGLASGITGAVGVGLLILAFIASDQETAQRLLVPYVRTSEELTIPIAAMVGAVMGFLWFNASPASVFMGDTGSLCLGGMIGYAATVLRQEAVVLIMCGVFLIEIGSVVIQVGYFKMTGGKRVFRCAPYHWHLRMGGWQEQKIVTRFWVLSILLVAIGLASIKLR
jgi:phospho-N-acetylmuramoyl-pentapeptide-transferase